MKVCRNVARYKRDRGGAATCLREGKVLLHLRVEQRERQRGQQHGHGVVQLGARRGVAHEQQEQLAGAQKFSVS